MMTYLGVSQWISWTNELWHVISNNVVFWHVWTRTSLCRVLFKLRNFKWCSVSSLTFIEYSSDLQRLWSDCPYAQADLRLCWSHIPHCWKSHFAAQFNDDVSRGQSMNFMDKYSCFQGYGQGSSQVSSKFVPSSSTGGSSKRTKSRPNHLSASEPSSPVPSEVQSILMQAAQHGLSPQQMQQLLQHHQGALPQLWQQQSFIIQQQVNLTADWCLFGSAIDWCLFGSAIDWRWFGSAIDWYWFGSANPIQGSHRLEKYLSIQDCLE